MIQSRQIEAFRAVMVTGSMTAAADLIRVTQSAVSRMIRDLEVELGFQVFDRRGNLVRPTGRGYALFREVERSFVGMQRIKSVADDLRDGRDMSLRIAALPAMATFLCRFVARFARGRSGLRIDVNTFHSNAVREQVVSGEIDIGIASAPFTTPGLVSTLLEDYALAAIPADHPLAGRSRIEIGDLAGEDLILLDKFSGATNHSIALALQGVDQGRFITTELSSMACALVAEGAGIAIVDPFGASDFVGRGLVLRPISPSTAVGVAVVHSAERVLSAVATEFRGAFVDHAEAFLRRADYLAA